MMTLQKTILASAALLALGGATAAAARAAEANPSPDPAPFVAEDDWIHKPTAKETWRFYPEHAQRWEREGAVRLRCGVQDTGQVAGCVVVSDSRPGNHFGDAALKMSRLFLIKPRVINGAVVNGALVTIPVGFEIVGFPWPKTYPR
jgi:protein TonB